MKNCANVFKVPHVYLLVRLSGLIAVLSCYMVGVPAFAGTTKKRATYTFAGAQCNNSRQGADAFIVAKFNDSVPELPDMVYRITANDWFYPNYAVRTNHFNTENDRFLNEDSRSSVPQDRYIVNGSLLAYGTLADGTPIYWYGYYQLSPNCDPAPGDPTLADLDDNPIDLADLLDGDDTGDGYASAGNGDGAPPCIDAFAPNNCCSCIGASYGAASALKQQGTVNLNPAQSAKTKANKSKLQPNQLPSLGVWNGTSWKSEDISK
jgi:hypothetical protein